MSRNGKRNLRVLSGLLLVLAAALVFLWAFSSRRNDVSSDVSPAPDVPLPTAAETLPPSEAPRPSPAPLPEPAPVSTPVPEDPDAEKIRISELMVKNRATLPDEDGDFPDWVELENISDSTVDLSGWLLRDSQTKPFWPIPELEHAVVFLSGKDLPGHADFSLSAGETLQLYTALGAPVAELLCPDGEADVAWIPGSDGGWESSLYPTPGLPNTAESYDALMEQRQTDSPLVLNEVCTYNKSERWTIMVGVSDWIELRNVSDEAVSLSEYYVSDQVDDRLLWRLPDRVLEPGSYFLIMCNEEGSLIGEAPLCDAFSLSSTADRVYLSRADGSLADYVSLRESGLFRRMTELQSASAGWSIKA